MQSLKNKAAVTAGCLLNRLFNAEDGGNTFPRNVGCTLLPDYTASYLNRLYSTRFTSGLRHITKRLYTVHPPASVFVILFVDRADGERAVSTCCTHKSNPPALLITEPYTHCACTYECGALISPANMLGERF
jgi:hypothetical protein